MGAVPPHPRRFTSMYSLYAYSPIPDDFVYINLKRYAAKPEPDSVATFTMQLRTFMTGIAEMYENNNIYVMKDTKLSI